MLKRILDRFTNYVKTFFVVYEPAPLDKLVKNSRLSSIIRLMISVFCGYCIFEFGLEILSYSKALAWGVASVFGMVWLCVVFELVKHHHLKYDKTCFSYLKGGSP